MAKTTLNSRSASGYQKYFDPRSLKSVASCAAMIFIIIHLIDYLCNFTIPLRILNFITLFFCLLVTFLFVVNDLGRKDEKLILGLANAALLFFSVIGFNSTVTSNGFTSARTGISDNTTKKVGKSSHILKSMNTQNASMLSLFKVRNWMPPAELENQLDTLMKSNGELRLNIQAKSDSLSLLQHASFRTDSTAALKEARLAQYKICTIRLDSLQYQNELLKEELQKYQAKTNLKTQSQSLPSAANFDTATSMNKGNYIQAYRIMKEKFENDLKRCQREADEYRSKYNILTRQSQGLMNRVNPDNNH
jgi:hypothetical protein